MPLLELMKSRKNSVITIGSVALSAVLLLSAFTSASDKEVEPETVYRESTVTRGDITVGVTETATATLKNHSLSFDIAGAIEEVYVKAGQQVRVGDPIASVSTDSIQDTIADLNTSYQEAALKVNEAQLSQQKGQLDAQISRSSTLNTGENAEATYEMTVYKLERAVEQAEEDITDIREEIATYNVILRLGVSDSSSSNIDYPDDEESRYAGESSYNSKYDKDFKTDDEVRIARDDAYDRLESTQATLKEAQYNLSIQGSEAVLSRDKSELTAEMADLVYQMDLQSLENSVTSQSLSLQKIAKQLEEARDSLDENVIVSPCDGIVTVVNNVEGDEIQAGSAVASISDSDNVFVYIAVAQDDITGVSMGQECSVVMDAFEELPFTGVVDSITTTPARNASGSASYNVTIRLEGDTAQVYEGMTGSATLITRQQKDVLYVTNRTVYQRDGQSYVKVKDEDGSIREVAVKTGFSDGRNVEITQGLTEGQTVLIESQVTAQS